jgi:hypothetical protein
MKKYILVYCILFPIEPIFVHTVGCPISNLIRHARVANMCPYVQPTVAEHARPVAQTTSVL